MPTQLPSPNPPITTRIDQFTKGWIVGNFEPSLIKTGAVEVGVRFYKKGDSEVAHHHKIATEITVVASGRVRMLGREFTGGDVILLPPGTSTAFEVLEDAVTTVVKFPGASNDKYID
jgi:quercetin dioxygenase-like cupin family protein